MGSAAGVRHIAAGDATTIAHRQGPPDRGRHQPLGASDVKDFAASAEDYRHQIGIAAEPPQVTGRDRGIRIQQALLLGQFA